VIVVIQKFSNTGYLIAKNVDVYVAIGLLLFLSVFFYFTIEDKFLSRRKKLSLTFTFFMTNISYLAIIFSLVMSN
jgi:hypothetical protein